MATQQWDPSTSLEKVLGIIPGFVYIFNQAQNSNDYANRSIGEMLGYSPDEVQAMGDGMLATLIHPDDMGRVGAHFEALHGLEDGRVLNIEYRVRTRDGSWMWLLSHDAVCERDTDGTVKRHIGVAMDITDQKTQEETFSASLDELETIFQSASDGIIALDKTGTIVRLNARARHMLGGISAPTPFAWPDEIRFLDHESHKPLDASADPVQRALTGHVLHSETHLMRRTQAKEDRRYVRVHSATVANEASHVSLVLILDDVSNAERNRQVIERKSRLDALGQLTGGIAHDFNNLLASLLYAVDLAGKTADAERRDFYLKTAGESINRGRALTGRLLSFARRQPGLASVRRTVDVLDDFLQMVRPMIEEQINIVVTVADRDLRHYCDQTQLETALMNLVLNARDAILHAGKGSQIDIKARAVPSLQSAEDGSTIGDDQLALRYVEISVSDDGPGMDDETLERSADPFFTTKDMNSGTGLGLAIVYGFARQSDGDFRIYSEPGIGTNVQLTLPRGTVSGEREGPSSPAVIEPGTGERILLVEDEPMLLRVMNEMLQDLGYSVMAQASGEGALQVIEQGVQFDLLLTDVVMPGRIGGFELARRARELRPDLPVIYMSGYTGFTATEMGAVQARLLQKPAPPADLALAIARALKEPVT